MKRTYLIPGTYSLNYYFIQKYVVHRWRCLQNFIMTLNFFSSKYSHLCLVQRTTGGPSSTVRVIGWFRWVSLNPSFKLCFLNGFSERLCVWEASQITYHGCSATPQIQITRYLEFKVSKYIEFQLSFRWDHIIWDITSILHVFSFWAIPSEWLNH